jgi:hypothetical protein
MVAFVAEQLFSSVVKLQKTENRTMTPSIMELQLQNVYDSDNDFFTQIFSPVMILYKSSNTNHVPVLQHYPKYF